MKKNKQQPLTDLEIFEESFLPVQPKRLKNKLEYRVQDLDGAKTNAQRIIALKKLQLEIASEGSMPAMRSFFVKPKTV